MYQKLTLAVYIIHFSTASWDFNPRLKHKHEYSENTPLSWKNSLHSMETPYGTFATMECVGNTTSENKTILYYEVIMDNRTKSEQ